MDQPAQPKQPQGRGTKWLAAWVLLTVWLCFTLASAAPNEGHYAALLLMVTVPGVLSRLFDLGATRSAGKPDRAWKRVLRRVAAVALGLPLAGALWAVMGGRSTAAFEAALAPLVAQVHAHAAAPCPPAVQYIIDPELRDYLRSRLPGLTAAQLYHDAQRFVLRFPGGSIDIDGSTVWYDSATRKWNRFHNDLRDPREAFEALIKPMVECRLPLQ